MNFEEWWSKQTGDMVDPVPWSRDAWNAAIDEAVEKINSHPAITDIEGYAIFPELAEAIKELKQ